MILGCQYLKGVFIRYRKLSPSGDYTFGNSSKDFFIDDPAGVGQAILTWLKLFRGEWYLDITQGTPWFDGIIGVYSQTTADLTIQNQIQNVIGVVDIESFSSTADKSKRIYSVGNCLVNTQFGPTALQIKNYRNY